MEEMRNGQVIRNPGFDSLEKFFSSMDDAYHMNHRNGEIGHYLYSEEKPYGGLQRIKITARNPTPALRTWG